MRPVAITGVGVIGPHSQPHAWGFDALRQRLKDSSSFLSTLATAQTGLKADLPAGQVSAAALDAALSQYPVKDATFVDRTVLLSAVSAASAWQQAGLPSDAGPTTGRVFWGTGAGSAWTTEKSYRALLVDQAALRPTTVVQGMNNAVAAWLAIRYQLQGPALTYSVACASSALAIGEAMRAIAHGDCDLALVGGCESILNPGMLAAWHALRVLAPHGQDARTSCKPFSTVRNGLVIGEGAAALVLESEEHAKQRGADILGYVSGYAASCDAKSMTAPQASTQIVAIEQAIARAQLVPSQIGYINAHATGTITGDPSECQAMQTVFGQDAVPPMSATKAMHGHLMGAAGAYEAAVTLAALLDQHLPPTLNCSLDERIAPIDFVLGQSRAVQDLNHALTTSFAFGGTNVALVLSK